jgi:hypothetical protein
MNAGVSTMPRANVMAASCESVGRGVEMHEDDEKARLQV